MATKKCRDCGGIVSKRAKTCPHCGAPVKAETSAAAGCLSIIIIVAVVWWLVSIFNKDHTPSGSSSPPALNTPTTTTSGTANTGKPAKASLNIGDIGVLTYGDVPEKVLVARTKPDLDRLVHLSLAKDKTGIAELVLDGKVFAVESGTHARLIDPGVLTEEIRVTEGEHDGESGFIPHEFLVRE